MKAYEIESKMDWTLLTSNKDQELTIDGVYICDLLSFVMSKAKKNQIWITIHTHINIVAVALLTEVSLILIPENLDVDDNTINKANIENILIFKTKLSSFDAAVEIKEKLL